MCEVLSGMPRGMSLSDLARALRQPASTVHRLLAVLKRRGYVRQDDETQRYGLTLKMLDLSFRSLGRSELRLHAYPIMREYVLRTPYRGFIAIPATGEVTYLWSTGPDEVAMRTVYGKEMPGHCAIYFSTAAGDTAAAELPAARHAGRVEQAGSDGGAAGAAAGRAGRAAAAVLHLRAGARLHRPGSGARRRVRPRGGRCGRF